MLQSGSNDDITQATNLLTRVSAGDANAAEHLTPLLYDRLRQLAGAMLTSERASHTLQPTALVHEAYVKLIDQRSVSAEDEAAFMGLAATIMRRVLVDHARAHKRLKRGGSRRRVALEDPVAQDTEGGRAELDVQALDEALVKLGSLDERKARLVELRFFCGLDEQAAAAIVGISRATASREWRMARSWLMRELEQAADR
ncbi:MAG: ECF-type sigma factor [Planctomycetota bacterium]